MNLIQTINFWKIASFFSIVSSFFMYTKQEIHHSVDAYNVALIQIDSLGPNNEKIEWDTIISYDPLTKNETIEYISRDVIEEEIVEGMIIDTFISFDPDTYEEVITLVEVKEINNLKPKQEEDIKTGIDTIITFDPQTFDEEIIIINHDTGQRDTIK